MIKFQCIYLGFHLKYRNLKQKKECNYFIDMFFQNTHLVLAVFLGNYLFLNIKLRLGYFKKQRKENISILVEYGIEITGK